MTTYWLFVLAMSVLVGVVSGRCAVIANQINHKKASELYKEDPGKPQVFQAVVLSVITLNLYCFFILELFFRSNLVKYSSEASFLFCISYVGALFFSITLTDLFVSYFKNTVVHSLLINVLVLAITFVVWSSVLKHRGIHVSGFNWGSTLHINAIIGWIVIAGSIISYLAYIVALLCTMSHEDYMWRVRDARF